MAESKSVMLAELSGEQLAAVVGGKNVCCQYRNPGYNGASTTTEWLDEPSCKSLGGTVMKDSSCPAKKARPTPTPQK